MPWIGLGLGLCHEGLAQPVLARRDAARRLHPEPRVHVDTDDQALPRAVQRREQRRTALGGGRVLRTQRGDQLLLALLWARLGDGGAAPVGLEAGEGFALESKGGAWLG